MRHLQCKLRLQILCKFVFFVLFFAVISTGCTKKKSPFISDLNKEEQQDLDYFLRHLIIRNSGAFVLFGSKPLCDAGFFPHVVARENSSYERNPMDGWKAWEKIKDRVHPSRYVLLMEHTQHCVNDEPKDFVHFVLMDRVKVALILEEHYDAFKDFVGFDFHPFEIVLEADDPNSPFWKKIISFNDTIVNGLLFGFGKKNALLFKWRWKTKKQEEKVAEILKYPPFDRPESSYVFPGHPEDLYTPGFIAFDDEPMEKYKKELQEIKRLYKGKDFLEVTLQQLSK